VTVPGAGDRSEDPTEGDWVEDPDRIALHANLDPRLVVESSGALEVGRVIPLEGGMTIGRSEAAGIRLEGDQFASHMHARIMRRGAYHFVEDLGSTNGTFLNDRRIERDAQLKVRDELRIGQTILRYEE
jgi:pSer/pThr/pTyr-binding forkhead associated (FHA) protein